MQILYREIAHGPVQTLKKILSLSEPLIEALRRERGRDAHKQWTIIQHAKRCPSEEAAPRRGGKYTQLARQMGLEAQSREGTGWLALGFPKSSQVPWRRPERNVGYISAPLCPSRWHHFTWRPSFLLSKMWGMALTSQGDCGAQIKQR